jgi:glucan 1,3-beta-glucosidase
MGLANVERSLNYIRIFTEFISQPEYANVVVMFGIVNEALVGQIGRDTLLSLCVVLFSFVLDSTNVCVLCASDLQSHNIMRAITGLGEGKGPYIAISGGLNTVTMWPNLLIGVDRVALDTHPYFAFSGDPNTEPINVVASDGQMGGTWTERACTQWKVETNDMCATIRFSFPSEEIDWFLPSQTSFGVTFAGEYSNGINDCGFYLQGTETYVPKNPDCAFWNSWENWDQNTKDGIYNFMLASTDALEHPFFWTWKVGAHHLLFQHDRF